MRIALTGASGFIGSVMARLLAGRGHEVSALVRATSRRDHIEDVVSRFVVGDQCDAAAWRRLVEGADAVVHNSVDWDALKVERDHLQRNLIGSLEFLAETRPLPFVFVSTIAVHHDMLDRWGGRPDEDHPMRPATMYGAYKAAVESHLWAEHFGSGRRTSAVRPCGVYGIDPDLTRSHGFALLKQVARGERIVKPGGGKFVHVEDVARAVAACIERDESAGQVYNLVDCYARWGDWAVMAAGVLGREADVDLSSPAVPKNEFGKDRARELVKEREFLERGHEGIRSHLAQLAALMAARGELG